MLWRKTPLVIELQDLFYFVWLLGKKYQFYVLYYDYRLLFGIFICYFQQTNKLTERESYDFLKCDKTGLYEK